MKAALTARVDVSMAKKNYSNGYSLGYPENCPVHSDDLPFDIYGRNAPYTTINTRGAPDGCSDRSFYNTQRRIAVENLERPYIPISVSGSRWGAEPMGAGRNFQAHNLYEQGVGDGFARTYLTQNDAPPDPVFPKQPVYLNGGYQRRYQNMDASIQRIQI